MNLIWGRDQSAVAELTKQGLTGVRQELQSRQTQEPTGPFNSMHKSKNAIQRLSIGGIGFEYNKLGINCFKEFIRFSYEFSKKFVH